MVGKPKESHELLLITSENAGYLPWMKPLGGEKTINPEPGTRAVGPRSNNMTKLFNRFTTGCARFAGQPTMLFVCIALAALGIVSYFVGEDRLIAGANLSISIVTLLLLPILQATQNRDGAALQAKIDELIKANGKARDDLIGLENRDERAIERMRIDEGQRAKTGGTHSDASN